MQGHLQTWVLHLFKIGKGPLGYILNFKHLSQEVLKEKLFEYFSMYFYDLNLGPPVAGPSWTLGPSFEQTW